LPDTKSVLPAKDVEVKGPPPGKVIVNGNVDEANLPLDKTVIGEKEAPKGIVIVNVLEVADDTVACTPPT